MRRGSKFLNFSGSSPSGPHSISKLKQNSNFKLSACMPHSDYQSTSILKKGGQTRDTGWHYKPDHTISNITSAH
jgi:hypothetical protein